MFQRMMAIPQEEYLQLTAVQAARQPMVQQMQNLTSQYEEESEIRDPYRRLLYQAETLDQMKTLKDKLRQQIVLATPKPFQSRTRSLFQHLDPILKLNERGEIFNEQGQAIADSRIDDLIQHAVRDRRRPFNPTGWDSFLRLLRMNNIPKYMLNRNTLDELEARHTPTPVKEEKEEDDGKSPKRGTKRGRSISRTGAKRRHTAKAKRQIKVELKDTRQRPKRATSLPKKFEGFHTF